MVFNITYCTVQKLNLKVMLTKVKAHSGDILNGLAYTLAKEGQLELITTINHKLLPNHNLPIV